MKPSATKKPQPNCHNLHTHDEHWRSRGFFSRLLVKVGGCVVSMAPLTIVNHGFWSFNPTCYFDGLTQNGFSLMLLQARTKSEAGATFVDFLPSPTARRHVPDGAVLMCAAKKLKAKTFEWPVQSKYLPLKGRSAE